MYIDPNSGGMLFQVLAVVFGVLSGTIFMFAGKIKMGIAKFRRSRRQKDEQDETPENNSDIEK